MQLDERLDDIGCRWCFNVLRKVFPAFVKGWKKKSRRPSVLLGFREVWGFVITFYNIRFLQNLHRLHCAAATSDVGLALRGCDIRCRVSIARLRHPM